MEEIRHGIDIFLHLDQYLGAWSEALGPWLYFLLFAIVFCETGLVVTPFLPGDSLLFAVGALASIPSSGLSPWLVASLLVAAAVLGDGVNYAVGAYMGPKVFHREHSRWLDRRHLERTHEFYEKYGGKTIFLARFVPIVRTFAPFVAGIGSMTYSHFALYNVAGAFCWVLAFLAGGYWFGRIPTVQRNFHIVIVAIIAVSLLPIAFEYLRARRAARPA